MFIINILMIINLIHKWKEFSIFRISKLNISTNSQVNRQFSWLTGWRGVCNSLVSVCKRERQEVETHSRCKEKKFKFSQTLAQIYKVAGHLKRGPYAPPGLCVMCSTGQEQPMHANNISYLARRSLYLSTLSISMYQSI